MISATRCEAGAARLANPPAVIRDSSQGAREQQLDRGGVWGRRSGALAPVAARYLGQVGVSLASPRHLPLVEPSWRYRCLSVAPFARGPSLRVRYPGGRGVCVPSEAEGFGTKRL
jgi:hypothetical protein